MVQNEELIGNLTTIVMFVFSACGGGAIIESLGGTSQTAILVGAIIGLGYSILNAYFPNHLSILGNNKQNIKDIANSLPKEDEECVCYGEEECVCDEEECC